MPTVQVALSDLKGTTGMFLFLYKSDGSLINAGGDALTDAGNVGLFSATVSEAVTGFGVLRGAVCTSASLDDSLGDWWLTDGGTLLTETYPYAGAGGGSDVWNTTQRDYVLSQLALLTVSGAIVVVPVGPYMCTRAEVNRVYGSKNVDAWADLNNNANAGEITAQIEWCIAAADSYFRAALASSQWIMPVSGDVIPAVLSHAVATYAGVLLYDPRGAREFTGSGEMQNQLAGQRKYCHDFIKSVLLSNFDLSPLKTSLSTSAPVYVG